MKETEEEAYFSQPDVKPSVRPAQIAKADCILSHPGGLLGKFSTSNDHASEEPQRTTILPL